MKAKKTKKPKKQVESLFMPITILMHKTDIAKLAAMAEHPKTSRAFLMRCATKEFIKHQLGGALK